MKQKMVNDVAMATIYDGMTIARLEKLLGLYNDAVYWAEEQDCDDDEIDDLVDERFRYLCHRASTKSGWYAATHPKNKTNRKVKR